MLVHHRSLPDKQHRFISVTFGARRLYLFSTTDTGSRAASEKDAQLLGSVKGTQPEERK